LTWGGGPYGEKPDGGFWGGGGEKKPPPLPLQEGGFKNETSPPKFSVSGRGRCRAPGRVASCAGASLSVAAGAHHRARYRRCRKRHPRAADGTMAVGAARAANCYPQQAAGRQQDWHRGGRACPGRRLHAPVGG